MHHAPTSPWLRSRPQRPDSAYRGVLVQVGVGEVDMGGLKSLYADAYAAYWKYIEAQKIALQNHTGYVAALSTNKAALEAYEKVRVKAAALIDQLIHTDGVDQSWFDGSSKGSPVWYSNNAVSVGHYLADDRKTVLADMAAHFSLSLGSSDADAEDAAAKADKLGYHAGTRPNVNPNPNAGKSAQDPTQPAADAPPVPEDTTGSTIAWVGGAVVAAILVLKYVLKAG